MHLKPILLLVISAIFVLSSMAWAQDVQTGSFRITSTSEAILGKEMASEFKRQIDIDEEINWRVFVPEAYDINCNPSVWRQKEPDLIDLMRQNRYYFIAGRDRTEQIDNRQEIRKYRDAGIENVKFVRTGRLSRTKNLNRTQLIEAIDYLDGNEAVEDQSN